MTTTFELPSFEDPPVIEVAASVQFDPLAKLTVPYLGMLWQRFRKEYPVVDQQPPLAPVIERLGVSGQNIGLRLEMMGNITPRLWFSNTQGDHLVQVQNDRFILNWRRVAGAGNPYPRYQQHIRPQFLTEYARFQQFLIDENLGAAHVNQCELTYINQIEPNEYWTSHADVASVFRGWTHEYAAVNEYPVEALQISVSHVITDTSGAFVGRLHVALQSALTRSMPESPAEKPVFVLTLTARGRPMGDGDAGMVGFLDLAHKAIVTSFDRITTEEAHKVWRKEQ